ncbi:MAG: hypothetical protein RR506_09835, partial [Akkermansia sp.]
MKFVLNIRMNLIWDISTGKWLYSEKVREPLRGGIDIVRDHAVDIIVKLVDTLGVLPKVGKFNIALGIKQPRCYEGNYVAYASGEGSVETKEARLTIDCDTVEIRELLRIDGIGLNDKKMVEVIAEAVVEFGTQSLRSMILPVRINNCVIDDARIPLSAQPAWEKELAEAKATSVEAKIAASAANADAMEVASSLKTITGLSSQVASNAQSTTTDVLKT